jgi:hypothetical protein
MRRRRAAGFADADSVARVDTNANIVGRAGDPDTRA